MHLFHEARQQLVAAMDQPGSSNGLSATRVVQLGDLGGYQHRPGKLTTDMQPAQACFYPVCSYILFNNQVVDSRRGVGQYVQVESQLRIAVADGAAL
jgi:hypothetical protein